MAEASLGLDELFHDGEDFTTPINNHPLRMKPALLMKNLSSKAGASSFGTLVVEYSSVHHAASWLNVGLIAHPTKEKCPGYLGSSARPILMSAL